MARINLLPWRQEERERKNKEFNMIAVATAALAILAVLAIMMVLNGQLSNQQAANDLIRNENTRLDGVNKEIEGLEQQRDEMISRLKVIQDLQGQRSVPVRIWDDIARALPQSMYLVSMKREGNIITLSGFADNPNVVSQLIRNLDASPWLDNSGVPNIRTDDEAYKDLRKALNDLIAKENRPLYPEDNYIEFVVTTHIKIDAKPDAETGANTEVANNNSVQPVESAMPVPSEVPSQTTINTQQPAEATSTLATNAPTSTVAPANTAPQPQAPQNPAPVPPQQPDANGSAPVQAPPVASAPAVANPQTGGQ